MFPTEQWVFLAFGTDGTTDTQYGFRYQPRSVTTQTIIFKDRTLIGPPYTVSPSCTAFWGGDTFHPSYGQTLQFVRLYIDYVPTNEDQMINLAMMKPGGIKNWPNTSDFDVLVIS